MVDYRDIRFGCCGDSASWETVRTLASYADESIFDSFWMLDHIVGLEPGRWEALEAWTVLAALALTTKRIELGSSVSDAFRHHPATLAQRVATCDIISQGRVNLGIGIGGAINLDPYGIPWKNAVRRTTEAIEVIKCLWTEIETTYSGETYSLNRAWLFPKPVRKPHPPIWVAGNSRQTMAMAAKLADVWLPCNMTPEEYREKWKIMKTLAARKDSKASHHLVPAHFVYLHVGSKREEVERDVLARAKMFLMLRPRVLKSLGFALPLMKYDILSPKATFRKTMEEDLVRELVKIPDEAVEKAPLILGSPEEVIEKIDSYIDSGVRCFITPFLASPENSLEVCRLFVTRVLPYFRASN